MPLNQVALVIKDEKGGYPSHAVTLRHFLSYLAEYAQPHHSRLSLQLSL